MPQPLYFIEVVDRESTNTAMSNNGGDYSFSRIIAVRNGEPVAVYHWTSSDLDYCGRCGTFERSAHEHYDARESDCRGWQTGIVLHGERHERWLGRYVNGQFAGVR